MTPEATTPLQPLVFPCPTLPHPSLEHATIAGTALLGFGYKSPGTSTNTLTGACLLPAMPPVSSAVLPIPTSASVLDA